MSSYREEVCRRY